MKTVRVEAAKKGVPTPAQTEKFKKHFSSYFDVLMPSAKRDLVMARRHLDKMVKDFEQFDVVWRIGPNRDIRKAEALSESAYDFMTEYVYKVIALAEHILESE